MMAYHPKLSCRRAEFTAFANLSDSAKEKTCPWFILKPEVGSDESRGQQALQQISLLGSAFGQTALLTRESQRVFIQTSKILDTTENFKNLRTLWLAAREEFGLNFVPVLTLSDIDGSSYDLLNYVNNNFHEVCVLIDTNEDNPQKMNIIYKSIHSLDGVVNLNLDVGAITETNFPFKTHELQGLSQICRNLEISGDVSIAAAGFPEGLGRKTRRHGKAQLPRWDARFFETVLEAGIFPTNTVYSDYTTLYPQFEPIKIPPTKHNAYLRYTSNSAFYVFRGGNIEEGGHRQIHRLAKRLVSFTPQYRGPDYSFGDRCIFDWAYEKRNASDPRKWTEASINQHMEYVASSLSS